MRRRPAYPARPAQPREAQLCEDALIRRRCCLAVRNVVALGMSAPVKTYGRATHVGRAFLRLLALFGLVWLCLQPSSQNAATQAHAVQQAGLLQTSSLEQTSSVEAMSRLAAFSAWAGGSGAHIGPQGVFGGGLRVVPTAAASALAGEPAPTLSRSVDEGGALLSPALSAAPDEAGEPTLGLEEGLRARSARRLVLVRFEASAARGVPPHDRPPRAQG